MADPLRGPIHGPPADDLEAFEFAVDRLRHALALAWTPPLRRLLERSSELSYPQRTSQAVDKL